jgi:hypothetical protein
LLYSPEAMPWKSCALIASAVCVSGLPAREDPGNALRILNAWLAQASVGETAYRADLRIEGKPGDCGPGRLPGLSVLLGRFSYRPRTYGELTPMERRELLGSAGFRGFLQAARACADGSPGPGTGPSSPPACGEFAPSPGEFLSPGALWLVLAP